MVGCATEQWVSMVCCSVLASRNYAAVWTRDDESLMGTHELLKLLKLPTMLDSDASLTTVSGSDSEWQ